jgi:hypothetical protein
MPVLVSSIRETPTVAVPPATAVVSAIPATQTSPSEDGEREEDMTKRHGNEEVDLKATFHSELVEFDKRPTHDAKWTSDLKQLTESQASRMHALKETHKQQKNQLPADFDFDFVNFGLSPDGGNVPRNADDSFPWSHFS